MWSSEYAYPFTIICACYNVERWILHFFDSLSRQTLDFETHIQVILVDDGSTDGTAALAKQFSGSHPRNTRYIYKDNEGPASARNCGIPLAEGEWLTFTDPDDVLADDYFENIMKFIHKTNFDGNIIASNLLLLYENSKKIVNDHPLHFKFADGDTIIDLEEQSHYVQLSMATACVRHDMFKKTQLVFDTKIRPTFEDAHLLNKLLLLSKNYKIGYLQSAVYYYRKRSTEDSLLTTAWSKQEVYADQLFYGNLNLVQFAKQTCGDIPEFIQNVILYNTLWYMNRLLENRIPYRFSQPEFDRFMDLMRLIFSYIDAKNILFSKLPMLSLRTRIAILHAFKKLNITELPVFVQEISQDAHSIQLVHYSGEACDLAFSSGDTPIQPLWKKHLTRSYAQHPLCMENIFWLPFEAHTPITCRIEGKETRVISRATAHDRLDKHDVLASFYLPESALPEDEIAIKNMAASAAVKAQFENCWLFADRAHKADDNAEHLYRWLMQKPDFSKKIYFVLDAASPDWDRLAREGFKLLAYKSDMHKKALWNAEWLISSHADIAVRDPLACRDSTGSPKYKFAFLGHGITKNDLSRWLNTIRMDMFVACTQREYASFLSGPYKFCEREAVLTGFPRYDRLLEKAHMRPTAKHILLCPTWRWHLKSSEAFSGAPSRAEVQKYLESDFFKGWNALLSSPRLAEVAEHAKARLLLLPHPEVERFIGHFTAIPEIKRIAYKDVKSIQDLILSCGMAVTDYSSMVMDFAYIGRPVFYYQFPEHPWFFSGDVIRPGYFSYEEDGFGPVLEHHEELTEAIRQCLARGGTREEQYEQRANAFFTLRDGHNCARVLDAIMRRS